jgi:glycosyltransferase involved in cell wall biosynthesis
LVLIEAMACGTPVIAFNRGSVPEIVEDGLTVSLSKAKRRRLLPLTDYLGSLAALFGSASRNGFEDSAAFEDSGRFCEDRDQRQISQQRSRDYLIGEREQRERQDDV